MEIMLTELSRVLPHASIMHLLPAPVCRRFMFQFNLLIYCYHVQFIFEHLNSMADDCVWRSPDDINQQWKMTWNARQNANHSNHLSFSRMRQTKLLHVNTSFEYKMCVFIMINEYNISWQLMTVAVFCSKLEWSFGHS